MNDYYGKLIAELEAHIEDREHTINDMNHTINDMSGTYERLVSVCSATLDAQHETIERLQAQLAAALATIEAAANKGSEL